MKKQVKKRVSVERNINEGTMTEREFRSFIISALRNASRFWKPKIKAIQRAKIGRNQYKCELCGIVWPASLPHLPWNKRTRRNIQADHIERAVDPLVGWVSYDTFIKRLFVEASAYQAICWECHSWENWKTKQENLLRKENRKNIWIN